MKKITVFHLANEFFGEVLCERDAQTFWMRGLYRKVATIDCDGREDAYMRTQNVSQPWPLNAGVAAEPGPQRSTSVGDIIRVPGEGYYMCRFVGWSSIDSILDLPEAS